MSGVGYMASEAEKLPVPGEDGELLVVIAKRWVRKYRHGAVYRVRSYRVISRKHRGLFLKNHEDHGWKVRMDDAVLMARQVAEDIGGTLLSLPDSHSVRQDYPVMPKDEWVLLQMSKGGISQ